MVWGHAVGDRAHPLGHPSKIQTGTEVHRLVVIEKSWLGQLVDADAITSEQIGQTLLDDRIAGLGIGVREHGTDTGTEKLRDPSLSTRTVMVCGVAGDLTPNPTRPEIHLVAELREVDFDRQWAKIGLQAGRDIVVVDRTDVEDQAGTADDPLPKFTLDENRLQCGEMDGVGIITVEVCSIGVQPARIENGAQRRVNPGPEATVRLEKAFVFDDRTKPEANRSKLDITRVAELKGNGKPLLVTLNVRIERKRRSNYLHRFVHSSSNTNTTLIPIATKQTRQVASTTLFRL